MRRDVRGHVRQHTRLGVADDEHIEVQRLQREDGVEHGLALHARGQLHLQIDDIGAQATAGQFK